MKSIQISFLSLVLTLLIQSCSTSTKITAQWTDKNYQKGNVSRVLILGITPRETIRRVYEIDLAERLEAIGVEGSPSSEVFPSKMKLDTNTFRLHFKNEGYDVVITSQLVSADKEQHYQQGYGYSPYPYNRGFYGYYGSAYDMAYSPGYSYSTTTLKIETKMYDTKTEQIIWAGISDTFNPSDDVDAIRSLNRKLVYEWDKAGFFKSKK
ncbi:MAG: hypothetical protein RIC15_07610 [Vicingaceae bacterium]